ncbi:MAG: type II restriction endonuclease [Candidatus Saccharicenans sp.]|nr:type II restriction endonuclease [Candidatus Saccharicenans sp.]
MKVNIYEDFLKLKSLDEIKAYFFESLLKTNHSCEFFVDWRKIRNRVKKLNIELSILNALIRNQNFDDTLREILKKYPSVLPCIPLLLAVRKREIKTIDDFFADDKDIVIYEFKERQLSDEDIENILRFFDKTGLKKFLMELATFSIQDYLYGIEVGIDSNARKNRSGNVAEEIVKKIIENNCKDLKEKMTFISQRKFKDLAGVAQKIPKNLENRRFDFVVLKSDKSINIEVNFYNEGGSKPQEIVDSYINRNNELKRAGWEFIWITDGPGWNKGKNQLEIAFDLIDYVLNLKMAKIGLLKKILEEI